MINGENTIHLFGGEREYCMPGMDGYVKRFDDIHEAMLYAEAQAYEWSHIIVSTPNELKIVNVGRWDNSRGVIIWQADISPHSITDKQLSTCIRVLRDGLNMLASLPYSRYRAPILKTSHELFAELEDGNSYPVHIKVYLFSQLIDKTILALRRSTMNKNMSKQRQKWCKIAAALLDDTKSVRFNNEGEL